MHVCASRPGRQRPAEPGWRLHGLRHVLRIRVDFNEVLWNAEAARGGQLAAMGLARGQRAAVEDWVQPTSRLQQP